MKYNGTTYELTPDELHILQGCVVEIRDALIQQVKSQNNNFAARMSAGMRSFLTIYGENNPFDLIKEILIDIPY